MVSFEPADHHFNELLKRGFVILCRKAILLIAREQPILETLHLLVRNSTDQLASFGRT